MTLARLSRTVVCRRGKIYTVIKGRRPKGSKLYTSFRSAEVSSFPLDVWMKRIMHELYGFEEGDMKGMAAYARENFGEYSGFAQQYLFYYARENL